MPGVGGGARGSVLRVLSRLGVTQIGPSTSGGLPGRSLAPFGLWPPPTPRAPPRMALLGAIWSCRRAQMGSMLPLEHGWVLWTSHGRGVPLKTPWWCQMLRYCRLPGFGWYYSTRVSRVSEPQRAETHAGGGRRGLILVRVGQAGDILCFRAPTTAGPRTSLVPSPFAEV